MWGDQCNTCGAHENSVRAVLPCQFCGTKICGGCKPNHEPVCAEATKLKKAGAGPTVVMHHNIPASPVVPDIVANLPEATKVASQIQDETIIETAPGQIAVDVDAVNAKLAEAEANEKALAEAQAALLAATPLLEAVAENPAVAALLDPSGLLQAGTVDGQPLESNLTVGDVVAPAVEEPVPSVENAPVPQPGVENGTTEN